MAQEVLQLMKEGDNKLCADCQNPMPQWASVSFGTFICIDCSGTHRSLGVHISFVRSLTMDRWQANQVAKMRLGGNAKWQAWCEQSEGYSKDMSILDKYNSHFAACYRDKLTAELEGRTWTPADTPPPTVSAPVSSLRKPRNSPSVGPAGGPGSGRTSPASLGRSTPPSGTPTTLGPAPRKEQNESYFASLGAANAARPDNLPPSQGGRYSGFGSGGVTPLPGAATSSKAVPRLSDFQGNPGDALRKGFGFLSATFAQAGRAINETVIEPATSRTTDPALQSQVWGLASRLQNTVLTASRAGSHYAAEGLKAASEQARQHGYEVGNLGSTTLEGYARSGRDPGYSALPTGAPASPSSHLYDESQVNDYVHTPSTSVPSTSQPAAPSQPSSQQPGKARRVRGAAKPQTKEEWDSW